MARAIHPSEMVDPDFEQMIKDYCERNNQAKVTESSNGTTIVILNENIEEVVAQQATSFNYRELQQAFKRRRKRQAKMA